MFFIWQETNKIVPASDEYKQEAVRSEFYVNGICGMLTVITLSSILP
jgi:hypothetical protein